MKTNYKQQIFRAEQINWEELTAIGILKDKLELDGHLATLLKGEKTGVISLRLTMPGADLDVDATMQFVCKGETPLLEITGVSPISEN